MILRLLLRCVSVPLSMLAGAAPAAAQSEPLPVPPAPPAPPYSPQVRRPSAAMAAILARPSKEYHGIGLIGGGVKDKQRAPNRWRVRGFSLEFRAVPLAMYRAALLAKKAGFSHMQVVKTDLHMTQGFMMPTSQNATLEIVGVRSANEPLACENKTRNIALCRTHRTDTVIRQAGAELGRGPAQAAIDLAAL